MKIYSYSSHRQLKKNKFNSLIKNNNYNLKKIKLFINCIYFK